MPNESSIRGKQPGKNKPLTFCLLETRTESRFIFVLRCMVTAPSHFALMKFPPFHLLVGTEVYNHVFIQDVSLDMSSTSIKTSIHLITAKKIVINYDKVNISLSFHLWYQLYTKTPLEEQICSIPTSIKMQYIHFQFKLIFFIDFSKMIYSKVIKTMPMKNIQCHEKALQI